MMKRSVVARTAAGAVGGLMLVGMGSAALAANPDADSSSDVNVNVEIEAQGALTMTVAANETSLVEEGSTDEFRQFTGQLPEVTVTDTRESIPEGVFWSVTGQASDFTGNEGQGSIGAGHLGWNPVWVSDENEGVAIGDDVPTIMDESTVPEDGGDPNNLGLVGQELLYMTWDAAGASAENDSWTANADLTLKTETDVAPGSYTSVLTLSLFEDAY